MNRTITALCKLAVVGSLVYLGASLETSATFDSGGGDEDERICVTLWRSMWSDAPTRAHTSVGFASGEGPVNRLGRAHGVWEITEHDQAWEVSFVNGQYEDDAPSAAFLITSATACSIKDWGL